MSAMETSENPNMSSLSAARYKQLTASKSCFLSSSLAVVAIASSLSMAS